MAQTSYASFIRPVWKKGIEEALEKKYIFVNGCTREFEGEAKDKGDKVKIKTMGDPTLHKLTKTATSIYDDIETAETLTTGDLEVVIDQIAYYNIIVSDIDEVQADESIRNKFTSKIAKVFRNDQDVFVANFSNQEGVNVLTKVDELNPTNVVDNILAVKVAMQKKNVDFDEQEVEAIVTPEFQAVLVKAGLLTQTSNDGTFSNGVIGKALGITFKSSNNVAKNTGLVQSEEIGALDMIQFRVKNSACAFIQQFTDMEAYRPENKIGCDAIKGMVLYGGKVFREDEFAVLPIKTYNYSSVIPA